MTTHNARLPAVAKTTRENHSLSNRLERSILVWLAKRLPRAIHSDHLTLMGLAAMVLAGVTYGLSNANRDWLHLVNLLLFVNWLGDSLDGTLARVRSQLRPRYGYYVDHLIDSVGALFLFGGIAYSGLMTERIALALLIAYFLISINSYLAAHALGRFRIAYFRMGPTELRILLAIGNLVAIRKPAVTMFGNQLNLFDVAGSIAILAIVVTFLLDAVRNTRMLYQQERI